MDTIVYHNPRCSKSRATLDLLAERGVEVIIVEYLKTPPDPETLAELLARLGISARELLRTGEAEYRSLGLDDPELSEAQLIQAMAEHPALIERPIVVRGSSARIGRPPEAVLDLL